MAVEHGLGHRGVGDWLNGAANTAREMGTKRGAGVVPYGLRWRGAV
jgi:hypothetical protein